MTDKFDAYYVWLGIPPAEQPPDHYRLLGINCFEDNLEVIENAADKQTVHLRTFQLSKQRDQAEQLLNAVASARICLLNSERKAAYDQQLREAAKSESSLDSGSAEALQQAEATRRPTLGILIGAGAAVVVVLGFAAWLAMHGDQRAVAVRPEPETAQQPVVAKTERPSIPPVVKNVETPPAAVQTPAPKIAPGQPPQANVTRKPAAEPPASKAPGPGPKPMEPNPAKPQAARSKPAEPRAATTSIAAAAPPTSSPQMEPPLPPPAAVAPFDALQAKQHQATWAQYLQRPVEEANSVGMKLALIPPGEFDMGSTDEEIAWASAEAKRSKYQQYLFDNIRSEAPRHRVKITKPLYFTIYPVTQGEYEEVIGVNPSNFTERQLNASAFKPPLSEKEVKLRPRDRKRMAGIDTRRHPVETVSWNEAIEFCRRLSAMPAERAAGRVYRLPTEAEWEYACRAGTTTRWYSGDDAAGLIGVAWINKDSGTITHPVGQKKANAWGLYDMHGNVFQWCADGFSRDYYQQSPPSDPLASTTGSQRVARGGNVTRGPCDCRSASRLGNGATAHDHSFGFRVVAEVAPGASDSPNARSAPPIPHPQSLIPSFAAAPFNKKQAKQHQRHWAEYLSVPVEENNSLRMPLVLIPPGEFDMGSTPEQIAREMELAQGDADARMFADRPRFEASQHRVKISRPFYMGMCPVTQGEYEKIMGLNPSGFCARQISALAFKPPLPDNEVKERRQMRVPVRDTSHFPVETVSWTEAMAFCVKLSELPAEKAAGRRYRLPTEAEWEYACRAGTTTRWWSGDEATVRQCAWCKNNSGGMTHPGGQLQANPWGLYEMHGNVWQWCSDRFSPDYYGQSPASDPKGPLSGSPVCRGGCWNDSPLLCRSASRYYRGPSYRRALFGFRVVAGL
jgi:formylglycine-generating enzyme required for sulfatase activity